jgi:hypothetical protein
MHQRSRRRMTKRDGKGAVAQLMRETGQAIRS